MLQRFKTHPYYATCVILEYKSTPIVFYLFSFKPGEDGPYPSDGLCLEAVFLTTRQLFYFSLRYTQTGSLICSAM
jgi:hypothetical protein